MAIGVGPLLCCFSPDPFRNRSSFVPELYLICSGTVSEPFQYEKEGVLRPWSAMSYRRDDEKRGKWLGRGRREASSLEWVGLFSRFPTLSVNGTLTLARRL